ncbi:DivIVA domain-containing protein [Corynebacterium heidelbergense]|uniref:DivIVA domain-containing protein n=1 Tax=Corynebacterium heidelbergense TaxID=2055947 RepID=A0A364VE15_9CORY|nr:DivIVA domain-containing protein [Corynebacterium heidelbergense]RAV34861.1 hypothetical protein CWC39_01150 [Corynebacterium heidelbergense]WCZ36945.1 hypothetical protein CHEID_07060 [Corynebacterium heidelbergense]
MYWLLSLAGALLVGCVLALLLAQVFGRGERLPDVSSGPQRAAHLASIMESPITADRISGIRFSVALRGYRMAEVDAYLRRVSARLAELEATTGVNSPNAAADAEPNNARGLVPENKE